MCNMRYISAKPNSAELNDRFPKAEMPERRGGDRIEDRDHPCYRTDASSFRAAVNELKRLAD